MSSEEIEPDAYSFERYFKMKTDSETKYAPKHPEEWIDEVEVDISIVPESIDKLFSAETILERYEDILEEELNEHGFKRKSYRQALERLIDEIADKTEELRDELEEEVDK